MIRAVRGAIQAGSDSRESIEEAASRLLGEIALLNRLDESRVISILFSVTADLTAANPATGLRRAGYGETALFCLQEARSEGSLPRMIRVLVTYRGPWWRRPRPVYLDGAEALRPDLFGPG